MGSVDSNEYARAGRSGGSTSRRSFLHGTAGAFGAVLASPGDFYKMIDAIAAPPERSAVSGAPSQEQYLLQDGQIIDVDGSGVQSRHGKVAVHVPPLHDHVVTAKLNVSATPAGLQEAQQHLESVLLEA